MSGYRIFFKAPEYKEFELPVNPQEVSISYPSNTTSYDVEGIGEIIVPRLPKLATVGFESFFPRTQVFNPMINSDSWYTPEWYVAFFRNLQKTGIPFELTIIRGSEQVPIYEGNNIISIDDVLFDSVSFKAVILDFTTTDKGGEPGDIYFNLSVSEYRDASPQVLSEVAKEDFDFEDDITVQERVILRNRPAQEGEITVDTTIRVNGPSFEDPEQEEKERKFDERKQLISQVECRVSRVLPPKVANIMHSIYVAELGWLNKKDCSLPDTHSNIYGIKKLIVSNV